MGIPKARIPPYLSAFLSVLGDLRLLDWSRESDPPGLAPLRQAGLRG